MINKKQLPLKEELEKYFSYDKDTGKIYNKIYRGGRVSAGQEAGSIKRYKGHSTKYLVIRFKRICYRAHRLAYILGGGKGLDETKEVDHINHDGLDNRFENLRIVSHKENLKNQKLNRANTTGYQGVHFQKNRNKYTAYIKINKKKINLGYFLTAEEAYKARKKKEEELGYHENHGTNL